MSAWELSNLGIEFAVIFVGFVFLGNYLDEKFDLAPWSLLGCAMAGFGIAVFHMIKRADEFQKKNGDK
ncbi:MAG: AtpZ/AtpI family protein [Leptospiraceae bacterium]|nr:AtpZ/AtpI family protein [Leptospiraceae bacterium]